MKTNTQLILVDEQNRETGTANKEEAHLKGLMHRAFSVFVFHRSQSSVELLLQKRKHDKYHSGGLWSNTCCSHPYPTETVLEAGKRRLLEEMGFSLALNEAGVFHYFVDFGNGYKENEVDHVLIGFSEKFVPKYNPDEVEDYQWLSLPELEHKLIETPEKFTYWFAKALQIAGDYIRTS